MLSQISPRMSLMGLGVISVFLAVYGYVLTDRLVTVSPWNRSLALSDHLILSLAVSALFVFLYRLFGRQIIWCFMMVAGVFSVLSFGNFSPIDEASHFAYVEYLLEHRKIPHVLEPMPAVVYAMEEGVYPQPPQKNHLHRGLASHMYQAVHPPLYYMGAALLSGLFSDNAIHRHYFLRCIGLLALLSGGIMVTRFYQQAVCSRTFAPHPFLWTVTVTVFTLTPGILTRMTMVSNLHLALVLDALFYGWILRSEWKPTPDPSPNGGGRGGSFGNILLFGILTGLTILTHPFHIFLVGVGLYYLFRKGIRQNLLVFLLGVALITLPWVIFNRWMYGHSTGYPLISGMMQNAVNPTHTLYELKHIIAQLYPKFFRIFWNPEESRGDSVLAEWTTQYLSFLLILLMGWGFFRWFKGRKSTEHFDLPQQVFLVAISLNFLLLVYLSLAESVPCVLGRYLYFSLWPLIFLSYASLSKVSDVLRKTLATTILIGVAILWTHFFAQKF